MILAVVKTDKLSKMIQNQRFHSAEDWVKGDSKQTS